MAGKSSKPVVVYWDTNIFVYLFQNQAPDGMDGINHWRDMADRGEALIVTSSLTFVEIMEGKLTPEQMVRFEAFMSDRVEVKDATPGVMRRAAELREHYYQAYANRKKTKAERRREAQAAAAGEPDKFVSLCTPDAIHVATGLIFGCAEFHTYDRKKKKECLGLLGLVLPPADAGMKITKPEPPPPPPPPAQDSLFDAMFAATAGGNGESTAPAEADEADQLDLSDLTPLEGHPESQGQAQRAGE